jgi:hypothetical protein
MRLPKLYGDKWARFDAYPREVKELFWYAHNGQFAITAKDASERLPCLKEMLAKCLARDCLETYGPDHPQAERGTAEAEAARLIRELGL